MLSKVKSIIERERGTFRWNAPPALLMMETGSVELWQSEWLVGSGQSRGLEVI